MCGVPAGTSIDCPSAQHVLAAVHPDLHRARDHLEPLDLRAVHVALRQKAAWPTGHLHLEQLAVRIRGRPQELDPKPSCFISNR